MSAGPRHIVFVSIPAWGHTLPVVPGLAELARRGHRLSAVAASSFAPALDDVATVTSYASPMDGEHTSVELSDMSAVLPLMLAEARASFAALEKVLADDRPDVVVSDVLANAGYLFSRLHEVPLVRTWPVFASNAEFSLHEDYASRPDDPEAMGAFFGELSAFLHEVGLDGVSPEAFFESEAEHNIGLYPRSLQPRGETFGEGYRFVTPCIRGAEDSPELPWLRAADPLVAISLGTVFTDNLGFFRACIGAVEELGWHAAAAIGGRVRPDDIGPVSDRVLIRRVLPMIDTLAQSSVLISHGGLTSTIEALAHGVPVLLAPQIGEQHAVADRIEALGLGARLIEPLTTDGIAEQVRALAGDTETARRVQQYREQLRGPSPGAEFADAVEAVLPT